MNKLISIAKNSLTRTDDYMIKNTPRTYNYESKSTKELLDTVIEYVDTEESDEDN